MNILSHKINSKRANEFIKKCDNDFQPIAKKIIHNTIHISFEVFYTYLLKNTKWLLSENPNLSTIYFFYDSNVDYKKKSNYWISLLFINIVKKINSNIKFIYCNQNNIQTIMIDNNSVFLFIDDCIYSGNQMTELIKYFTSIKLNKNIKIEIENLKTYLFVSFITDSGLKKITDYFHNYFPNNNLEVCKNLYLIDKSTNYYLTKDEIKEVEKYYYQKSDNVYLIYFDHKLADDKSTIPLFYSGLIANENNLELMESIYQNIDDKELVEELKNELEYYPFIQNCENIRNFNIRVPECPKPRYKNEKEYIEFINSIKKNSSSRRLKVYSH